MKKLLIVFLVVLVVGGVAYAATSGFYLKGAFRPGSIKLPTVATDPQITVSVSRSTPASGSITAGSSSVPLSTFTFAALGEEFMVDEFSINVSQSGITAAALGDSDNNISSIRVSYLDVDGVTQSQTSVLVAGTAQFSGVGDFYLPINKGVDLTVTADLDSVADGATVGETIRANLAFNDFEAVGQSTGTTWGLEYVDADLPNSQDLYFGAITYTDGDESFDLEGAQSVSNTLGGSLSLTIDSNATSDNSNKLPVGTILCVDDDNSATCNSEDIYVVTSWPSSTSGTEDSVTVMAIDDAGDSSYDDNDPLLYAMPGTGFLTNVGTMTVVK